MSEISIPPRDIWVPDIVLANKYVLFDCSCSLSLQMHDDYSLQEM